MLFAENRNVVVCGKAIVVNPLAVEIIGLGKFNVDNADCEGIFQNLLDLFVFANLLHLNSYRVFAGLSIGGNFNANPNSLGLTPRETETGIAGAVERVGIKAGGATEIVGVEGIAQIATFVGGQLSGNFADFPDITFAKGGFCLCMKMQGTSNVVGVQHNLEGNVFALKSSLVFVLSEVASSHIGEDLFHRANKLYFVAHIFSPLIISF